MSTYDLLVFSPDETGHNVEYVHHLYNKCASFLGRRFVFVVPIRAKYNMSLLYWRMAENIEFDYITEEDQDKYNTGPTVVKGLAVSRILKNKIKLFQVENVLVLSIIQVLPILFIAPKGVHISGILYKIYFYEWRSYNIVHKISEALKYILLSKLSIFTNVYVLNDSSAVSKFNRLFSTRKYLYLPDPFMRLASNTILDLRSEYSIDEGKKIFVHFGAMSYRKGTLKMLDSFNNLSKEECSNWVFIFAGKIENDIRNAFYQQIEKYKEKVTIIVEEGFCSYDFIYSLCMSCDVIVLPYLDTSRSSGLVGYAAQFRKPIIAPNSGLLGKIVRKNRLGILIGAEIDSYALAKAYSEVLLLNLNVNNDKYCKINSVEAFCEVVISSLLC